jgi:ureidoacrylate peracid hydrolase
MEGIRPEIERRMLKTLNQKVDPHHAMLVIVDVQNDFCAEGGLMDREGADLTLVKEMVPHLKHFISAAREYGIPVLFVKTVYNNKNDWYLSDVFLEHMMRRRGSSYTGYRVCEPDSWGGSFYGGVEPVEGEPVVIKHRSSAFHSTDLDLILRSHGIRSLILTGVATDVCVESTARNGFFNDYYIILVSDCCATYSVEDHEHTLKTIDRYFGQVISSKEIIKCWSHQTLD